MKVTEHFVHNKDRTLYSFEILPPLKGGNMRDIFHSLDPLMEFEPPFIDVTYHREEFVYKLRPSGFYEKTAIRKRPGTVGICTAISHHYGIDTVPHLICGGFTKEDTENALIDLNFLDIKNVLALRGDGRKFDGKFIPESDGHQYAIDLVRQIADMNHGIYLDEKIENGTPTDFCVGVAGYPEKHFEAPSYRSDLAMLKHKVDAGADYIVTQMFFDNERFFQFVRDCRELGIGVPIIPGIKPLTKASQLVSIPRGFFINLPDSLVESASKARSDGEVQDIGVQWCIDQCRELKKAGVPCIHFYTMGDAKTIHKIISSL